MNQSVNAAWVPPAEHCPQCRGLECLIPVSVDTDVYYTCTECHYAAGLDDSFDNFQLAAEIVVANLDENGLPMIGLGNNIHVKIVECKTCGNGDVNRFRITGCDVTSGMVTVECMECQQPTSVSNGARHIPGENDYDDNVWDPQHDNINAEYNDEFSGGRMEEDGNSIASTTTPCTLEVNWKSADDDHQISSGFLYCDRCGNDIAELFSTEFDGKTDRLKTLQCHVCLTVEIFDDPPTSPLSIDLPYSTDKVIDCPDADIETIAYIECSHCGNDAKDRFLKVFDDSGHHLVSIHCMSCRNYYHHQHKHNATDYCQRSSLTSTSKRRSLRPSFQPQLSSKCAGRQSGRPADGPIAVGRERIFNLSQLNRGDHVAWHKWYAIWHHAIIIETDSDRRQLTVIHNSGSIKPLDGKLASVRLETIDVNPDSEELYRIVYKCETCFAPDDVVKRAALKLGQTYNPFTNNCEHFARWCKTGRKVSRQVSTFADRVASAGKIAVAKQPVMDVAHLMGGGRAALKAGSVVGGLVANVAVEGAVFAREAQELYRKYKCGEISESDFRQQLAKLGCECVGGLAGGALGLVSQMVIPIPFIGGFIGSSLGNLVGRWCGAVIGKKFVNVTN